MTIDLEELRQKKAAEELAASHGEASGTPVITAFVVVQTDNGQWTAMPYDQTPELAPERRATVDDMVGGCATVQMGCTAQQTAFQTMMMMQQQAQQMQAAVENQRIAQQLNLKGK